MIDYKDIGNRNKTVRKRKICLKTVIDIINALHCSADELLWIEIEQARPRLNDWFVELLADCSDR